jgi:two-component system response regulator YesN
MSRRLLVVDDSIDVLLLIKFNLRRCKRSDLTLITCEDPREALHILAQTPPDLLLTDVNMPFLSGPELIEQARAAGYTGPAVLASNVPLRGGQASADAVLDKSEVLNHLCALLQRWLPAEG